MTKKDSIVLPGKAAICKVCNKIFRIDGAVVMPRCPYCYSRYVRREEK